MNTTSDPRWPRGTTGLRALVECDDPAVQDGLVRALQEQGYVAAVCAGPNARASGRCPLVADGSCGLVQGADVVVHALDPADPAHREVLAHVQDRAPDVPVIVEVPASADATTDPRLAGCEAVPYPMTRDAVLAAAERSVRR